MSAREEMLRLGIEPGMPKRPASLSNPRAVVTYDEEAINLSLMGLDGNLLGVAQVAPLRALAIAEELIGAARLKLRRDPA